MPFDNICKRLAEFYPRDFATWLLGQPVAEVEVLKTELSKEPLRADSLILLCLLESILRIEFQTTPRSKPPLPLRMLDYWVQGYRRFETPIEQFVIIKIRQRILHP
jgi:predicted transposase YdaD